MVDYHRKRPRDYSRAGEIFKGRKESPCGYCRTPTILRMRGHRNPNQITAVCPCIPAVRAYLKTATS